MTSADAAPIDTSEDLTGDPRVHLLFATFPLLRIVRGDRRDFLRRAWLANALPRSTGFSHMPEGRTPSNPRDAALCLFDAVVQVARTNGIDGPDLAAHFNRTRESGSLNSLVKADDALEHAIAALMVLVARRLQAERP